MQFILMQKDNPVLEFQAFESTSEIRISKIINEDRLPFHLQKRDLRSEELKTWLLRRGISDSRPGTKRLLSELKMNGVLQLILKNKGLSLSDSYWINDGTAEWEEVSIFQNPYPDDIGNFLLKGEPISEYTISPDICTNGCLEKAWKRINGKDYLFKMGKAPYYQEPLNEIICTEIAKRAFPKLEVVNYHMAYANEQICSACENFVTEDIEFVPASYIFHANPMREDETIYSHFLRQCRLFGIRNVEKFLASMIAFDYLICNQDRHLGNFGFLRNVDSGLFIGPAPLFDNGNALWFDENINTIGKGDEYCKPFEKLQEDQFKLVQKLHHIDIQALAGIGPLVANTMGHNIAPERIEKIIIALGNRAQKLDIKMQEIQKQLDFKDKEIEER